MRKDGPVTIQDIAQKANVSISTVSRVLNDNKSVGDEFKTAVLQAVQELDYQPNFFAQGLAGGQSRTIGVITQNIGSPVYDAILKGILEKLSFQEYAPIFADGQWDTKREQQVVQTLMAKRIDGLIIVGGSLPPDLLIEINDQMPLVVVARQINPLLDNCIYMDNFTAAYDATKYLLAMGHKSIAHISGIRAHSDTKERQAGFEQALVDAGLTPNPELVIEGDYRRQSGIMSIQMLLMRGVPFTAVFAANDQMAFGARLALFRQGLRVPEDVSLVGFDDQPDSAFMIPPLTTVQQPCVQMGIAAAQAILNQLRNDHSKPVQNKFAGKLIIRETTSRLI